MAAPILTTKLHIPIPRPNLVLRPRLIAQLNAGLDRKLTLISASAGFGKTTLISEWLADRSRPVAWLSLDEADSDPMRFLNYLVASLQTVAPQVGEGIPALLQSPQPPATEAVLTALLNDLAMIPEGIILVLDDYHAVDGTLIDSALTFLLEHLPTQMHLVIATREDPRLPLARLRARGLLTEVRATDLRFTSSEATAFLNHAMGLVLSEEDIATLESRTEGWIAGLQLAAISMQGHDDTAGFIRSFTGSHRYVLDYLVEEVLQQQPDEIQSFLLKTSILDRMCGPLCDAVLLDPTGSGRGTLEKLENANLFIVPLDNDRGWYRYHHLFAELLRQRLRQSEGWTTDDLAGGEALLHVRASEWFEKQGLEFEAFHHATAANDIERAERLANSTGAALYVRGGAFPVLRWLESLPEETLDARPSLWFMLASIRSIIGRISLVEETLKSAEAALEAIPPDEHTGRLRGQMSDLRSLVTVLIGDGSQMGAIIEQAHRSLEHLGPEHMLHRSATIWKLGLAYQRRDERDLASDTYLEAAAAAETTGNTHVNILATTCVARMLEHETRLHEATELFQSVLHLVGEPPGPIACEAYVGLARIHYERNDLETAQKYGLQSVTLAHQVEITSFVSSEVFLARLLLARGVVTGALESLAGTARSIREKNFLFRMAEVAAAQVRALIRQGNLDEAARLVEAHDIPISRARLYLAQGNTLAALDTLASYREGLGDRYWQDEQLKTMILQAMAYQAQGRLDDALRELEGALAIAEPSGYIRTFVDEGEAMAHLLSEAAARGIAPGYSNRLLAAFDDEAHTPQPLPAPTSVRHAQPLVEPLSQRELEILALIAQGLSNSQISDRLFLALATIKGHNRNIFSKLQVQRRTEAVARARELGLI